MGFRLSGAGLRNAIRVQVMKRRRFLQLVVGLIASLTGKVPQLPKMPRKDTYQDDLEKALLGSMMMGTKTIPVVRSIVNTRCFSTPQRGLVFAVISGLHRDRKNGGLEAVENDLAGMGLLKHVGGHEALVEMVESVPNPAHAPLYAESLVEKNAL